jgi:hypothetical protein
LAALAPYAFLLADTGQTEKVSYGKDIAPIFKAHCASCHSGETAARNLDLSSGKALLKGRTVVAGNPAASVLLQRIKGLGGKKQMPLGFPALSAEDTAKVERWISEGAKLDDAVAVHWAYVAPAAPKVPALSSAWVRNPIDAFVLERLKKEGLRPSPPASKEVLLRRVTLDLVGLPPTPAEMDAFLADKSPQAYEKVVDRLLASPHYGEKQARGWLDLARYADSHGYEKDLRRSAWKYRDWVIAAFNRNMPYDRFSVEQLAGDLLPNATVDDKVATGFHRNTMFNEEGGVDQEEAHFSVILDRVDTTATVWLGSTLACARCHDHKYDPFSQKDYYRMAAFFSNTTVYPRGPKDIGEEKWFEAEIPVPSDEQAKQKAQLQTQIAHAEDALKAPDPALDAAYERWKVSATTVPTWTAVRPTIASGPEGTRLTVASDGTVLASGKNPDQAQYELNLPPADRPITGIRIEALPHESFAGMGPGRSDGGNFVVTGVRVSSASGALKIGAAQADYVQKGFGVDRLALNDLGTGWAVSGETGKPHQLVLALASPLPAGASFSLRLQCDSKYPQHTLGQFRVTVTSAEDPLTGALPAKVRQLVETKDRTEAQESELRAYYRSISPLLFDVRQNLAAWRSELDALGRQIPTALVMEEKPATGPLTTFVRRRGEFLAKTEEVSAGTPAILPKLNKAVANRLDLAKWLVDPKNPLTSRVEVNRIWESYFGRGLVETSEDFGTRGTSPTHPELLDWLAVKFVKSGWNMKAMHRLIVMSSTYRQSSNATPALIAKDPQNLLLARGPRFRMEAEAIRDAALAASGLLNPELGGPSVFPYQPDGVWDSPYSGESWMASQGKDRYRRSLYTFWKRTSTYPVFTAFDATSRESCTVRRIRTNTPLQALTLLNDKEMMEAAVALGKRMRSAAQADDARLAAGFRMCTGRRPTPAEVTRLKALLTKLKSRYAQDAADAKKLGPTPADAAWAMVGNVLLNLDETITKG